MLLMTILCERNSSSPQEMKLKTFGVVVSAFTKPVVRIVTRSMNLPWSSRRHLISSKLQLSGSFFFVFIYISTFAATISEGAYREVFWFDNRVATTTERIVTKQISYE